MKLSLDRDYQTFDSAEYLSPRFIFQRVPGTLGTWCSERASACIECIDETIGLNTGIMLLRDPKMHRMFR